VSWGVYEAAIRHWETLLGRSAPHPTQPGKQGRPVLAPTFVEHLMGLPSGWVTDLHLPRTAQLRALGNGVVPQQAAHAVSLLLADLADLLGTDIPGTEFPIADHRSPAGQAVDENVDEDGDPDGCSPWSCRSGEPVTAAVDTERAA
jgi:DNA (cytosine-5)-methyltransferase 1